MAAMPRDRVSGSGHKAELRRLSLNISTRCCAVGGDGAAAQVAQSGCESLGPASSLLNVVLGSVRWVALLEQGGTGWPPGVPAGLSHCDFETDQHNSLLYTIIQVLST